MRTLTNQQKLVPPYLMVLELALDEYEELELELGKEKVRELIHEYELENDTSVSIYPDSN